MAPSIKELISLDVYRDGGSLSVTYSDGSENQFELIFTIDNEASESYRTRRFYKSATVIRYEKSEYVSPVTGIVSKKFERTEAPISWTDAVALLHSVEPLMNSFESDYFWVFGSMLAVAINDEHSFEYS